MESFSLLKFWSLPSPAFLLSDRSPDVSDAEDDDGGSFFDLEFDVSEDDNAVSSSASAGNGEGEDWNCDVDSGCPDDSSDCTSDDDLVFFKGDPPPISPSIDHSTTPKTAHFPLSLLKSSARLRILISRLKKPGTSQEDPGKGIPGSDPRQKCPRLFFKFKVEAKLARDNTSGPITRVKAGLRVVCRQLGKSKSGSSAVAKVPRAFEASSRRDDSLLLHQDGIQSAILHCKRSFNESGDLDFDRSPEVRDRSVAQEVDGIIGHRE